MNSSQVSSVSIAKPTIYTARDFPGYTLQHIKAMYPVSWQEAARHFGVALPEPNIRQIKQTAIKQKVWDFYPTPQNIIDKMIAVALVRPHHRVLEPSAGSGDLAQAIARTGVSNLNCFEINQQLQKALKFQGFKIIGADFLASTPQPIYDRIIANPPFSNNGVANHTQHAFKFLNPGGRLVTLAHHYKLKPSQSDRFFFAWLKSVNARFLNLGSAFTKSDRPTDIPLQLILIDKP